MQSLSRQIPTSGIAKQMFLKLVCPMLVAVASAAHGQQAVTTYHNDMQRTGWNSSETTLTTANVNPSQFGLLYTTRVDGQVYAEPLYVPGLTLAGKVHNVVYVCNEHNSVYAFDADAQGPPLWYDNLGPSVPNGDTGTTDINPEVGITGTPVIRVTSPGNGWLYVVAKTKESDGSGGYNYIQRLHALNIRNGVEMAGSPVVIQASVPGTGEGSDGTNVAFNPLIQAQRPALLLLNGIIYIAWASHGDNGPYHGWIMGYDQNTLAQTCVYNTSPNALNDPSGYPIAAGGIWQGGGGLASDGTYIFCATGNGLFEPSNGSYGDSILKLSASPTMTLLDSFTPSDQLTLDDGDTDLGSGGVMLLPDSLGSTAKPHLLVQSGKEGTIYLLSRDGLGGYNNPDQVTELDGVMGGIWGAPAYFNGNIYYGGSGWPITMFTVANALFTTSTPAATSSNGFGYPGPTPAVSSNGTQNGIVWAIDGSGYATNSSAVLWAYNASNLATLYSSSTNSLRDGLAGAVKFTTPLVANGKVYVGTNINFSVFGLGQWTAPPTVSMNSGTYSGPISVMVTDSTPNAKIYYTLDGSIPTTASTPYTTQIGISTNTNLRTRAFATGYGPSAPTNNNYLINPLVGTGQGLTGNYFNNMTLTSPIVGTRIDPTINFTWNGSSPLSGLGGDQWSVQWTGEVQAQVTGPYTFETNSDDGVQLFINGTQVIDDWSDHGPTIDRTSTINMMAGQKYTITVDYYQDGGGSLCELFWYTPGMGWEIVPSTQLYPN